MARYTSSFLARKLNSYSFRKAVSRFFSLIMILSLLIPGALSPTPALAANQEAAPIEQEVTPTEPTPTQTITITQTNEPALTTTPFPTLTDIPTEAPPPSATLPPAATQTPTDSPSPTPAPSSTPTAIPTLLPSPTPTVTSTAIPTAAPMAPATPTLPVSLTLQSSSLLVAPGDTFTLTWQIPNWRDGISGFGVEVLFPIGFIPLRAAGGAFDPDTHTLSVPLRTGTTQIPISVGENANWPFVFTAKLMRGQEALDAVSLKMKAHWRASIPPQGGQAQAFAGKVKMNFPAGALEEAISLDIKPPESSDPILGGRPFEALAYRQSDGAEVHQFLTPITLEVDYDPQQVKGEQSVLNLNYYDPGARTWIPLTTTVDIPNHKLIATTDHLTLFDFNAEDWEATRLPSMANFQVSTFTGASSYSFPFTLPPGPGGLQPSLALSYNSQSADGGTARTQASWVGLGWSLDFGSIQRNQNGTPNWDGDDTFSLNTDGAGGQLMPIEDQDGDPNTEDYRLADNNFWIIRRYKSSGSVGGYTGDTSYWLAMDKTGNKYYFEQHAYYLYYSGGCSSVYMQTWQWPLTRVVNIYGKEITYSYNFRGEHKHPKDHNGYVCDSYSGDMTVEVIPSEIRYANNRYQVQFVTQNNRTDSDLAWNSIGKTVFYQLNRLTDIRINLDANGDGSFETHVRRYQLGYGENSQQIFPNNTWPAGGKTLTLTSIREYGVNDAGPLPATNFTYGDGQHLTQADNGYGGQVQFVYEAWYDTDGAEPANCDTDNDKEENGAVYIASAYGNCSMLNSQTKYYHPGAYYRLVARIHKKASGTYYRFSIDQGGGIINAGPTASPGDTDWHIYDTTLLITKDASQALPMLTCDACYMDTFTMTAVTTRFRVTGKTLIDQVTGASYTFNYRYDEPATNDAVHSDHINTITNKNQRITPAYSDYRGNGMVEEIGPDGKVTTSFFYQDDYKKGRPSVSLVSTQTFQEDWEEQGENPTINSNWSLISTPTYSFPRVRGDTAIQMDGTGGWRGIQRQGYSLSNGTGVLFQFMSASSSTGSYFHLETGAGGTSDWKRLDLYHQPASPYSMVARYCYGATPTCDSETTLFDQSEFRTSTWYSVLMLEDSSRLYIRIWPADNPGGVKEYSHSIPQEYSWRFFTCTTAGTTYFDAYRELKLYNLSDQIYDYQLTNLGTIPEHDGGLDYLDLDIVWAFLTQERSYTFEQDAVYSAQKTNYTYDPSYQGGGQYGNPTQVIESAWITTTNEFKNFRETLTGYYPYVNLAYLKNLSGLPGFTNQYNCPNGTCSLSGADLLSSSWYLYDNHTSYNVAPLDGKLTGQRTFLRYAGANYTDPRYSDVSYGYDTWGNQNSVTKYTNEGTASTLASSVAQQTVTNYDPVYHTYAIEARPLNLDTYKTTWTYDDSLGLPLAETDANNQTTSATYDEFGRMTSIRRPGDESPSRETIKISYFDTYFQSYGTPFLVNIEQKLDESTILNLRKFYNGLGQKIQVQTAGANVKGYLFDLVVDTKFDGYGQVISQTVPYTLSPWYSGMPGAPTPYRGQDFSRPGANIAFDVLGRQLSVTAPDHTTQRFAYFDTSTVVTDALGIATTTTIDERGRTHTITSASGPTLTYTYNDAALSVTASRGGVTSTTYTDYAGRKVKLEDQNLGTWSYTYDAVGNLLTQTGPQPASQCALNQNCTVISFLYDNLNRLTDKTYSIPSGLNIKDTPNLKFYYDDANVSPYAKGRRTKAEAIGLSTTSWTYDQRGRVVSQSVTVDQLPTPNIYMFSYTYNSADLMKTMIYPDSETVTSNYDNRSLMTSLTSSYGSSYANTAQYDEQGRMTQYYSGNGILTTNQYNLPTVDGGRLNTLTVGENLLQLVYDYDAIGNISSIVDDSTSAGNQTSFFTYDGSSRLLHADTAGGVIPGFNLTYDYKSDGRLNFKKVGEITYNYTYTASQPDAATSLGSDTYSYDSFGNMTTRMENGITYHQAFNADNKLAQVSWVQDDSAYTTTFAYDADGNRLLKIEDLPSLLGSYELTTVYIGGAYEDQKDTTLQDLSGQYAAVESPANRGMVGKPHGMASMIPSKGRPLAGVQPDNVQPSGQQPGALLIGNGTVFGPSSANAVMHIWCQMDPQGSHSVTNMHLAMILTLSNGTSVRCETGKTNTGTIYWNHAFIFMPAYTTATLSYQRVWFDGGVYSWTAYSGTTTPATVNREAGVRLYNSFNGTQYSANWVETDSNTYYSNISPSAIKGRWWYSERVDHRAAVDRVGMSYFTVLFEQDISAPSTSAGLSTYSWTNGNVTATASASDGTYGTGIGHHYCRLEGEGWTDAGASSTCTRTATANTTFYYYAVDKAGNNAAVKSLAITNIDKTAPSTSNSLSTYSWTNGNVTAYSWSSDSQSGVAHNYCRLEGEGWSDYGTGTCWRTTSANTYFYYYSTDALGNASSTGSIYIGNIDKAAPSASYSLSTYNWTNGDVTAYSWSSDSQSGVAHNYCKLDGEGWTDAGASTCSRTATYNTMFSYYSVDAVGNASSTVSISIWNMDKSAPTTSYSLSTYNWTNGDVTASSWSSDSQSGVAHNYCRLEGEGWSDGGAGNCSRLATANTTFYYYSVDAVGNNSSTGSLAITNIDKTAPSTNASIDPTTPTTGNVTASATASDSQSGVAHNKCKLAEDPGYTDAGSGTCSRVATWNTTFSYYAEDAVGNAASSGSISITNMQDSISPVPTVTVSGGDGLRLAVSWMATDNKSGIRDYTVQYKDGGGDWTNWLTNVTQIQAVFFSKPGHTVTFRVTAYDRANNSASDDSDGNTATALHITKYYAFGGRPVALRTGTGSSAAVFYLHSDHLGSVSLVTDGSGQPISQSRYLPFGEERWVDGQTKTDRGYTGQRAEVGFGLMDYNARYYNSRLGRFISADTIIPGAGNPQAWDRYAGMMNNPTTYNDPTGHMVDDGCRAAGCSTNNPNATIHTLFMGSFPAVLAPNSTSLGERAEQGWDPEQRPDPSGLVDLINLGIENGLNNKYLYGEDEIYGFLNYTETSDNKFSVTSIDIWNRSNANVSLAGVKLTANPPACNSGTCINGPSYNYVSQPSVIGKPNGGLGIVSPQSNGQIPIIPSNTSNQFNEFYSNYNVSVTAVFNFYNPAQDYSALYRSLSIKF